MRIIWHRDFAKINSYYPKENLRMSDMENNVEKKKYFIYAWQCIVTDFIIIISSIQPLDQFGQEPEPSQATGTALVRCILGKFLE